MNDLYIEIYGRGKTLVMIHGWGMHTGVWRSFAKALAQTHRVVCVDLPGHGRSASIESFDLAIIAAKLAQRLGYEPCCWLGWSLGGLVTLEVARQFPDLVAGLILLAANPCFVKQDDWIGMEPKLLQTFAVSLMENPEAALMRFFTLQFYGLPGTGGLLKDLKRQVLECSAPSAKVLSEGLMILQRQDLRAALAALACPAMTILGARDTLVPVAVAPQLEGLLPEMRMEIFRQAGHVPFLTHPEATLRAIAAFEAGC